VYEDPLNTGTEQGRGGQKGRQTVVDSQTRGTLEAGKRGVVGAGNLQKSEKFQRKKNKPRHISILH